MLPAIRAFVDYKAFGLLPYAGGIRDQDPALMRDLRTIASVVANESERQSKRKR